MKNELRIYDDARPDLRMVIFRIGRQGLTISAASRGHPDRQVDVVLSADDVERLRRYLDEKSPASR